MEGLSPREPKLTFLQQTCLSQGLLGLLRLLGLLGLLGIALGLSTPDLLLVTANEIIDSGFSFPVEGKGSKKNWNYIEMKHVFPVHQNAITLGWANLITISV